MVKDMGSGPITYLCDSGQVFNISINNSKYARVVMRIFKNIFY